MLRNLDGGGDPTELPNAKLDALLTTIARCNGILGIGRYGYGRVPTQV